MYDRDEAKRLEQELEESARGNNRFLPTGRCQVCDKKILLGCILCDTCASDGRADAVHDGG
jgi:hypothetical protein